MKIHLSYETDQERDAFLNALEHLPVEWQQDAKIKDNGKTDQRGRRHMYLLIIKKPRKR